MVEGAALAPKALLGSVNGQEAWQRKRGVRGVCVCTHAYGVCFCGLGEPVSIMGSLQGSGGRVECWGAGKAQPSKGKRLL